MGNYKKGKLIFLGALLIIGAVIVYWQGGGTAGIKQITLSEYLLNIPGYMSTGNIPLDETVVEFLDLDDYLQSTYRKVGNKGQAENPDTGVSLYVGYYNSLAKISAAHSPLVCFPGQGWMIDMPSKDNVDVAGHQIAYSEIIASLGGTRLLVLYWYQAGEKTDPEVYKNKINAVANKFKGHGEEHAFVRITVPIVGDSVDEARARALTFMEAFYPFFLDYVSSPLSLKSS